mmetsp:Transcript_16990/g.34868  ORF Transcript_16990/g.34868 Transcript_16990/m.34868 type:complete len:379 (-) Transcript_16990:161-1297(-)|eukprot:CAMPEP_0183315328 /NCGR_PEP_ID=MMETSP0160_2-20130417/51406_1 /TAXON_ID=2839 ORGANISM="Odontella Sinensis, Strain Grunow 1884" /NCGR_SAMPLE_ID=MMETSP0160_2 /ASSEMBLY_ACC=CAM_ASM_000250 /LENGTH=378 /DNA_ID=CAMNT_0025480859 /DNA_START=122 /DNA_END=1258 /DNA_ORIENTATION=-
MNSPPSIQNAISFHGLSVVERKYFGDNRIHNPHPHDILCGRGRRFNLRHPGNMAFRKMVMERKEEYCHAESRKEKTAITACIVKQIAALSPPGRFLLKDEENEADKGKILLSASGDWLGCWIEATPAQAHAKTSQALREGAPSIRQNTNKGPAKGQKRSFQETLMSGDSSLCDSLSMEGNEFLLQPVLQEEKKIKCPKLCSQENFLFAQALMFPSLHHCGINSQKNGEALNIDHKYALQEQQIPRIPEASCPVPSPAPLLQMQMLLGHKPAPRKDVTQAIILDRTGSRGSQDADIEPNVVLCNKAKTLRGKGSGRNERKQGKTHDDQTTLETLGVGYIEQMLQWSSIMGTEIEEPEKACSLLLDLLETELENPFENEF